MGDDTMRIGELAERTGLSLRTLRHWDEVGLVQASGRTDGGFRLYTAADEQRATMVKRMKPLGFTLEEMKELLAGSDGAHPLAHLSDERATYFLEEATRRHRKLQRDAGNAAAFVESIRD